ncbi:MAG: hypothetical protein ABIY55_32900 [Kofleriaceae bacterium]
MSALVLCLAVLATACGDNRAAPIRDAAPDIDAPVPPDAAPIVRAACLERPTDLALAPTGELPCELLPPGGAP